MGDGSTFGEAEAGDEAGAGAGASCQPWRGAARRSACQTVSLERCGAARRGTSMVKDFYHISYEKPYFL